MSDCTNLDPMCDDDSPCDDCYADQMMRRELLVDCE